MTSNHDGAALWGSAENHAYSVEERLRFALAALDHFVPRLEAVDDLCQMAERGGSVMVPTASLREALDG